MIIRKSNLLSPLLWSISITFKASPKLFVTSGIITIYTVGISGIINAYIISMTTASVANLANGKVPLSVPLIWAAVFGGFTLINNLLSQYYGLKIQKYSNMLEVLLYSKYAEKVMVLPQEQIDDPVTQEKLTSATREVWRISNTTSSLQNIVASAIGYIGAIIILWRYAWGIALLLLVIIPLLIFFNYRQIKRTRQSWQESTQDYRIASGLFWNFSNPFKIFQVRIMGAKQKILDIYKLHFNKAFDIEYAATKKNQLYDLLSNLLSLSVDIGTRIWAIVLVGAGRLAFDQFVFVMGLIQQASNQTWSLGSSVQELQSSYIATTAFKDIIDYEPAKKGTKSLVIGKNNIDIKLENAELTYRDGTKALNDISIHIKPGQKIAVVGENGAGKSSLLKLILMQYKNTNGHVFIDGIDSKELDQDNYYEYISVLAQDYFLFDDLTIKQNVALVAKNEPSYESIMANIELVGMTSKINSLKKGLNTRLDVSYKDGADLSGGQRQRIAIARALSREARLLILDEPTSSIDAKAERQIFNNIFAMHKESTVIIVSHRFATVRKADYIYVLDNGMIIEHGTHEQLMNNKKLYSELYTLQAEDFK